MPIIKTYHIAKFSTSGDGEKTLKLNFIMDKEKVSESVFYDLLKAKLTELLGDKMDQFDKCLSQVTEALESKKPVTIVDRNFEIKFKNVKEK